MKSFQFQLKLNVIYSLLFLGCFLFGNSLNAQNDTTNDTWRMDGENTITESPTIISKSLGIGPSNTSYEEGLHLVDKPLFIQRSNSPLWSLSSSYGPAGAFWIQNVTGNVNAFRIESNGRVGIGTGASITPIAQLHVKSYNHKALYVQGGKSQGNHAIFQTASNIDEPILSIFNNHQIGVNNTTPTATLEINSASDSLIQDYSGLKIKGSFGQNAVQIINDHTGLNAGGLSIETTDKNAQGNALSVKLNRTASPLTMIRVPNFQKDNNYVFLAEEGGKVGIGTTNPQKELDVCGHIRAKEIVVESDWCDYVFEDDYELPSLEQQANHIEKHRHLMNFKSASEMQKSIEVADVTTRQQKTIEEMMIYLIAMEKEIAELKIKLESLENKSGQ